MVNIAPASMIRLRFRRGVALLEVIIAAIILGVAVGTMVSLATSAVKVQGEGELLATAAMLADEQLNLVLARGADDYAKRFPLKAECEAPYQRFTYELVITGGSDVQPMNVLCTISWISTTGPRSIAIATAIAARPGTEPDPIRQPETTVERPQ